MFSNHTNSYFPYPSPRPGQLTLIEAIREEVSAGNHLCVEAANGFGKTIAALSGVLPLLEKKNFGIIYVARTHKQLDRVMQELKHLSKANGFSGVVLRGRTSSCLNPLVQKYAINAQLAMFICSQLKRSGKCVLYNNLSKKINRDRNFINSFYNSPLTGLEFRKKCENEQICPYELSKRLLQFATVVATSYYQIFDPQINSSFLESFARPLSDTILLIDEAHNLPRIAVEIASAKLSLNSIRQAIKESKRYRLSTVGTFGLVLEKLLFEENGKGEIKLDPGEINLQLERSMGIQSIELFSAKLLKTGEKLVNKLLAEGRPPISYIHSLGRFFVRWCHFSNRSDAAFFLVKNHSNRAANRFELIALDPRCVTASVLNSCHASVHLSGTLQPVGAHIDLVGLPGKSRILILPSPFSDVQIFPVISLGVTTAMKYRTPSMYEKITQRLIEVCHATPHNVGIFVPSYTVLQSLLLAGFESGINRDLFVEKSGSPSSENDRLVQAFKGKAKEGAVLLGVLGGRNSEGEDYPGWEMETVVVVGVPYARPSSREATRVEYFEGHFPKKGRLYGYHLPAMRAASQAAGRSVRSLEDCGAIVFLDDRYTRPYCKRFLPSWIAQNLTISKDVDGHLFKLLKSFYTR
jgi:DNA excision repair protein ERCC-2